MTNREITERAWECAATHGEILDRYRDRIRFSLIRRRFRVEDSIAGNSCLLMKTKASAIAARFRGKVVEVIPFTTLAERQAAGMPECSHCAAPKGMPCKSKTEKTRTPHMVRWADFNDE